MIDLLIAGGGPAGLATALCATRAGLEAVVVEPRPGPIDKACGEGLMPGAVRILAALGVSPPGVDFVGIRYLDGPSCAQARFRDGSGRGVRRTLLQEALLAAALDTGVRVLDGRIDDFTVWSDHVDAAGLRARYLVGADGLHSTVRRRLHVAGPPARARRWGLRAHFAVSPWSDHVEVHWSPAAEAYVTPVAPDCVGVAVLTSQRGGFTRQLRGFPALAHLADPAGPVLAAGPLRQNVSRRVAGRVLLVGDAAGYVDALTGEGITLAVHSAQALVAAVCSGRPEAYELAWRRITRRYRVITSALLWTRRHESLRTRLVPTAAAAPALFDLAVGQLAR